MKKIPKLLTATVAMAAIVVVASRCAGNEQSKTEPIAAMASGQNTAFQNYRDSAPSKAQWPNQLFELSHDYPASFTPVVNPTWQQALNGQPLSAATVFPYMDALKKFVEPNVMPFFTDNKNWNAAKNGWFQEPWMGVEREAILGAYLGNGNPSRIFKTLKEDEAGYALVLYDSTAGYTVGQIWGKTGQKVNLANDAAQFEEGAVIVKFAFSNITDSAWLPMVGAQTFYVYDTIATSQNPAKGYQVRKVSFFQMDVIVKDTKAAPKTGWVYSTFVYDKDAPGNFWEKMVPLGAMWGNDPDVISPTAPPYPALKETVINPKAPFYSKETLGWGGRLSGPNDGAVAQQAVDLNTGKTYNNLALSSCMSCHLPAQDKFKSFLLPAPFPKKTDTAFMVYTPGSPNWNLWFRDNAGTVPFDSGQVAMDYDMVMAFKSMSNYNKANPSATGKGASLSEQQFDAVKAFRRHNTKSQFWH